jgi:hypothetical protein
MELLKQLLRELNDPKNKNKAPTALVDEFVKTNKVQTCTRVLLPGFMQGKEKILSVWLDYLEGSFYLDKDGTWSGNLQL